MKAINIDFFIRICVIVYKEFLLILNSATEPSLHPQGTCNASMRKPVDQLLFSAYPQVKLNMKPLNGLVPISAPNTEFPKNLYSPS